MADAPTAPAPTPVTQEPTKIPAPPQVSEGAAALATGNAGESKNNADPGTVIDEDQEFELDIKGQKQKVKANRQQLTAILQKSLYADQMIKDATQAKKGAEALQGKLKLIASGDVEAFEELMSDPDLKGDTKKLALAMVRKMMDDEQLTPEQREYRDMKKEYEAMKAEREKEHLTASEQAEKQKQTQLAMQIRGEMIDAMKAYPDLPQNQSTMDSMIQYMRANFKRFGRSLPANEAIKLVSRDYWTGVQKILDTMPPEKILERFGQKALDKIQQLRLKELRDKTEPTRNTNGQFEANKKKKFLTEREYEKAFAQRIAGL